MRAKKMLNLTAHELTKEQVDELVHGHWGVSEAGLLTLPEELHEAIVQISFDADIESLAEAVMGYAETKLEPEDYLFVQGQHDFTAFMVQRAYEKYVPIFAFTKRESQEAIAGDQVVKHSVFRHLGFKRYTPYKRR